MNVKSSLLITLSVLVVMILMMTSCSEDINEIPVPDTTVPTLQDPGNQGGNNQNNNNQGNNNQGNNNPDTGNGGTAPGADDQEIMNFYFGDNIDLSDLANYESQPIPAYINEDNTDDNDIFNEAATLGRVLFYDLNLSSNNIISCASCHQQENAFGDARLVSDGVNGVTGRHSMRLINARFAEERRFFWDERANSLEQQTTMPIQDHIEMGFSGTNGDGDINDLILKLDAIDYYNVLFELAYGSDLITEARMQDAMAQFIRSIQSFDSKFDTGRSQVNNINTSFPNFTAAENNGKRLYLANPGPGGGAGCNRCHNAPEFDINDNSDNNGITGVIGNPGARDYDVTRSPTLRDLFDPNGNANSRFFHTGVETIEEVVQHYNNIPPQNGNPNFDNRLRGGRGGGNLNLNAQEQEDLITFLRTLSGSNVYTDERWENPFIR